MDIKGNKKHVIERWEKKADSKGATWVILSKLKNYLDEQFPMWSDWFVSKISKNSSVHRIIKRNEIKIRKLIGRWK